MITRSKLFTYLTLLILLLAIPALACTTLAGDGDEDEVATEIVEQAQSSLDEAQEQASESAAVEIDESPAEVEEESAGDVEPEEEIVEATEEDSSNQEAEDADSKATGEEMQEEILSALRSSTEVDAMRLYIVTEELNSGLVTEVTLAFVRPDRYHMSSEGVEFIIIDNTTYMSAGDDQWLTIEGTEMSSTVESTLDAFAGLAVIEERQNSLSQANVNYEGKETLNGVETLVYSFDEGLEGSAVSGFVKMWIGEDDGLLYRQEVESLVTGIENRVTMEFEYGSSVTIEPPQ